MTPVPAKDRPKLIGLAVGCLLMLLFVVMRVKSAMGGSGNVSQPGQVAGSTATAFVVNPGDDTGQPPPEAVASAANGAAKTVSLPVTPAEERIDLPPTTYGGPDPFRNVLPQPTTEQPSTPVAPRRPRPVPLSPVGALPGAIGEGVPGDLGGPIAGGSPAEPLLPTMPAAPNFRFSGMVGGRETLAVVEVGDKSFFVRVGDDLPGGWIVERADSDWLVIRKGAFRKRLRMPMDEDPKPI